MTDALCDSSDSRHYFQLKGQAAEQIAHELAYGSFLTDWCYPNPVLEDGKELCDLLVVFGDVAIIWQIKSLKLRADGHYNSREVEKNARQAVGAARRLLDVGRPLVLQNARRGEEEFDPATIRETFLISVLAGDGEDFLAATHSANGRVVHVFTADFMELALHELDTTSDFVDYLRAKEELLAHTKLLILGGEEELLATYLLAGRSFDSFSEATLLTIEDGSWEGYQSRGDTKRKKSADEISYSWDGIIDRAHECDEASYELVARELARTSRLERRILAKAMFEAAVLADKDGVHPLFRRTLDFNGRTYAFLFMDVDESERDVRQRNLIAMCYAARSKFRNNSMVIGIATEKVLQPSCSYDFCRLEIVDWSDDDEQIAAKLREEARYYADSTLRHAQEYEYPDCRDAVLQQPVGRNDPCPCGSGKKYKKCCLP